MQRINSTLNHLPKFALALLLLVVAAAANVTTTFAKGPTVPEATKNSSGDIVDTAVAAGNFTTLAKALEAAGLIDALKGEGPFTVFAPTDAAFAKLPAGTLNALLKPENKEKLKAILLYHVVSGKINANQVMKLNGQSVKTLQGGMVRINTKQGVRIDNANVTQTDIYASNGVIHVIDTVLMPPSSAAKARKKTRTM